LTPQAVPEPDSALTVTRFSCAIPCIFLFFLQPREPAARGRTRGSRNKKPGAACRPGSWRSFWRSFGEYLFLEDSRYTSQAENRAAIKSINQHRKSAFPAAPP
jgi:hypothetical protein